MLRVALAALAMWVAGAHAQPASFSGWIDAHAHLAGPDGFSGAPERALDYMQRHGVRTLVLMPPPTPQPRDDYAVLSRIAASQPGRFAFLGGGGTLNPLLHANGDPERVTDEVKTRFTREAEAVLASGAAGFGEIAVLHLSRTAGHPFEEIAADHPLLVLLADIAARADVVIDVHMDLVADGAAQPASMGGANPPQLKPNLAAFERLLAHNPKARIVWAHLGSDPIGHWTVERSRALLKAHPNLYMSLRLGPGAESNRPLQGGRLKADWLELFREFDDRFVIGTDSFHIGAVRAKGPGVMFSQANDMKARMTQVLLAQLPPDVARKIAYENAIRLYRLKPE